MRRTMPTLALAAGLWLGAAGAVAETTEGAPGLEEQMRLMNERMTLLESQLSDTRDELGAARDELDASRETVERQQEVMEKAGLAEDRTGRSGLDSFFSMVEVSGNVTVGWNYNFAHPSDSNAGANAGRTGVFYPFHPDHNTFELNQFWLAIEKPVTEESRAGFRLDMVYGKTASILGSGFSGTGRAGPGASADSASDFQLYQAYVQYLTPFGPTLRAGKFGTLLGAEVAQATENFNISRGNVYNLLQPFTHYGIIVDGEVGPVSYSIGGVNRGACCGNDPDTNDAKSLLAGLGVGGDTWGLNTAIEWGAETNGNSAPTQGTFDLILSWDPTERFSSYINFDYQWLPSGAGVPPDPDAWGVAAAGRFGITDAIGVALRFEYLQDSSNLFGLTDSAGTPIDADIWGLTGTFDWTITEGLIAKAEIRYDNVEQGGGPGTNAKNFISSKNLTGGDTGVAGPNQFTATDQIVGLVELTYQF